MYIRPSIQIPCTQCTSLFLTTDKRKIFCNRSCAATYNNQRKAPPSEKSKLRTSRSLKKYYAPIKQRKLKRKPQYFVNVRKFDGMSEDDRYRAYMREYMIKRYHLRRAEAIRLLGGKCANCNSESELEIDHINWRDKSIEVDRLCSVSYERFVAELKKCQVLCNECHIEKSRSDISEIRLEQERRKRMKRRAEVDGKR